MITVDVYPFLAFLKRGGGGAWTICRFKGVVGKKEGGGVFEGGG